MADEPREPEVGQGLETEEKMQLKHILWDDSGAVAHLTMNRPKQNVMNMEMLKEMAWAIESLNNNDDVRLVLLDASPECEG